MTAHPPAADVWDVNTPSGVARVHHYTVGHGAARATMVLGHGAGRGVDTIELSAIAAALPGEHGIEVILVQQPWSVSGQRVAAAPAALDKAWIACLRDLAGRGIGVRRLVVGGRSAGARVACRTVDRVQPAALFLLAFPVHPLSRPRIGGEPPPSRLPELVEALRDIPGVVVQGTRDAMGEPGEIALGLAEAQVTARVLPIPGADHSFKVPARIEGGQEAALDLIVRAARASALRIVDGQY